MPGPGHNGAALLELKRRHVCRRLNELQIRLGRIKQCQQSDGESKDGTRGCPAGGAGRQPPDVDGRGPASPDGKKKKHHNEPQRESHFRPTEPADGSARRGSQARTAAEHIPGQSDVNEMLGADQTIV